MQTNIDLPDPLLKELNRRAPDPSKQAELLSEILTDWFGRHPRAQAELELINENVDELNAEARDVLDYQAIR